MENNPLVTVNILSYNRKEELRNTLRKVYDQNYRNIEVIVVDNASTDGTIEMVENEFPSVILIKLNENIGISGWNKGFEIAKGEFVLVLDDDSYPDKDTIAFGVNIIREQNRIGVVAYRVFNLRKNKSETDSLTPTPKIFIGCGALISRKMLENVGYYNELIFIYNHELDFAARCYNSGYKIVYTDKANVYHLQSPTNRIESAKDPLISKYRYYHHFITFSTFLLLYFDLKYALKYHSKWFVNRMIIAIRFCYYDAFFKASWFIINHIHVVLRRRIPLKKEIQRFYDFGNHPWIDREHFPDFKKKKFLK